LFRPTTEEVLLSISHDFDKHIRPDPASGLAVSLSLTISNLLRHVHLRVQHEERLIREDLEELEPVLGQAGAFLSAGTKPEAALGDRIATAIADGPPGDLPPAKAADQYRVLLRGLLAEAIDTLVAGRAKSKGNTDYQAVRARIRSYLDHSLSREETLIHDAFTIARR